jgi:hypothetical protein
MTDGAALLAGGPDSLGALDIDCGACGATVRVEPSLRTATCPYCDSPQVVERPATRDRPPPTFVVGFALDRTRAEKELRSWLGHRWFLPGRVRRATVDHTRGVYLPAWLYGAVARARFTAEIGEDYQETETYTTTDAQGKTVTQTRTVTRTEWSHLQGAFDGYVLDVVVTASRGIPNHELQAVEPFDLRRILRYSPALISGWIAEEPTLDREACEALARREGQEDVARRIGAFLPGDHQRNARFNVDLTEEVSDLVLLPLWVFALRHDPEEAPLRLLVNGQTGKVAGKVPRSALKILGAVTTALALLSALALVISQC